MSLGELLGHGRTSDVHAWEADRAIKLFPAEMPMAEIEQEARDAAIVHAAGVPSPGVHGLVDVEGRVGIVFDRIHGDSLTTVSERNIAALPAVCRDLARAHLAMHSATSTQLPDVRELAVELLDAAPFVSLTAAERSWLSAHLLGLPGGRSVLHLDFHPQNVYTHLDGHVIIDWHSTCAGDPAADVAMTRLLMSEAELFPGTPLPKLVLYSLARLVMLGFYLREYRSRSGITKAEIRRWATAARVLRLGLLDIPSERTRLLRRIRRAIAKG